MADELRINVRADGADEAAEDLRGVANAERTVGDSAQATGDQVRGAASAKGDSAQAAREADDANRTLAERFRALGPEAALVGDAIDSLALKEGKLAAVTGVVGVAVLGATMLIQKLTAAREEERQKAQAVLDSLAEQAEAYRAIEQAAEDAARAEAARGGADGGQAPEGIVRQMTATAGGRFVGVEGIEQAATAAQFAAEPLTAEQLETLGLYLYFSDLEGVEPRDALRLYRAALDRNPDLPAQLRQQMAATRQRFPAAARERAAGAMQMQRATTPAAEAQGVLASVLELEQAAGGGAQTTEDLDRYIRRLLTDIRLARRQIAAGEQTGDVYGRDAGRRDLAVAGGRLVRLLGRYEEVGLGDVQIDVEQLLGPEVDITGGYQPAVVEPGEQGVPLRQVANEFVGGTHYHAHDGRDPAGLPRPAQAP
mgnify:CR=1 FL=1